MFLKYPQEIESGQDFVVFTHEPYRTNKEIKGQEEEFEGGGFVPPEGGVILYMPNSTPAVSNQNSWRQNNFVGPLGQITQGIGVGIAAGALNIGEKGMGVDEAIEGFKSQLENVKSKGGAAARQFILGEIARTFNLSGAGALTALQRGEVYNPNVELLYEAPQLRGFSMDFIFIPKNSAEAAIMNEIILKFKMFSSPQPNGSMLELPHLWRVTYKSGVQNDKFMNKFKKAALTTVSIQHNPGTDMHSTFSDGTPLVTAMSLGFQEVDIITRDNHADEGGQGF